MPELEEDDLLLYVFFGKERPSPPQAKRTPNERISDYNVRVSQKNNHFSQFRRRYES